MHYFFVKNRHVLKAPHPDLRWLRRLRFCPDLCNLTHT